MHDSETNNNKIVTAPTVRAGVHWHGIVRLRFIFVSTACVGMRRGDVYQLQSDRF